MNEPAECPFCSLPENRILFTSQSALAIRDAFPISPGHTLVIPNRHVESIFELENAERNDLFQALSRARSDLVSEMKPDGFNVGINDGLMAGQTVMHLHVHLIPRFEGDKEDPRGGIRWVFPEKAKYWP
jgi:diadenosine tetraphosphate (Ap4A) HIT family hydrolase